MVVPGTLEVSSVILRLFYISLLVLRWACVITHFRIYFLTSKQPKLFSKLKDLPYGQRS